MEVCPNGSLRFCASGKAVHTLDEEEEAALEHDPQEWRHHEQEIAALSHGAVADVSKVGLVSQSMPTLIAGPSLVMM